MSFVIEQTRDMQQKRCGVIHITQSFHASFLSVANTGAY